MKTFSIPAAIILILFGMVGMGTGKIFAGEQDGRDKRDDVMHPQISLLDKEGSVITDERGIISTERTCGQCHDTRYISN